MSRDEAREWLVAQHRRDNLNARYLIGEALDDEELTIDSITQLLDAYASERVERLKPWLRHKASCHDGRPILDPPCPQCGQKLKPVSHPGGALNREQWEAVRAGDYICCNCPDNGRANRPSGAYFWEREVPNCHESCTCGLAQALQTEDEMSNIRSIRRLISLLTEAEIIAEKLDLKLGNGAEVASLVGAIAKESKA